MLGCLYRKIILMRLPRFARNDTDLRLPRFARNDTDPRLPRFVHSHNTFVFILSIIRSILPAGSQLVIQTTSLVIHSLLNSTFLDLLDHGVLVKHHAGLRIDND